MRRTAARTRGSRRRRPAAAITVLVSIAFLYSGLATLSSDRTMVIVAVVATLFTYVLLVGLLIAAHVTSQLIAVDRADTFLTWGGAWCVVVAMFLDRAHESLFVFALLFGLALFVIGVYRAFARRRLVARARAGRVPVLRVREALRGDELETLPRLYGGNVWGRYTVLERVVGAPRLQFAPKVSAYRGAQPSDDAKPAPGIAIGLVPS